MENNGITEKENAEETQAKHRYFLEKLEMLREPFGETKIAYKPVPTRSQTDALKKDISCGIRCDVCGGWHHPQVQHLAYVGHAATTDRLLDVDPFWNWDFLCVDERGMPILDENGGLWITMTVCNLTRKGYGDAQGKNNGDAMKERIGDAIRNAAMRFGVALDLWHKGDLHFDDRAEEEAKVKAPVVDYFKKFTDAVNRNMAEIIDFKNAVDEGDLLTASGIWYDFSEEDQQTLHLAPSKGGILTTKQREILKSSEFSEARRMLLMTGDSNG